MFKKLSLKSSKKTKGEARRTSTDSVSSGGAAVPYFPTSPTGSGGDVTSLLEAASFSPGARRDSDLTGSPNGHAPIGPQIPIANAGGTLEEGRLLGEAAGKNDLEGVRVMIKEGEIPVNTLDEVLYIFVEKKNYIFRTAAAKYLNYIQYP